MLAVSELVWVTLVYSFFFLRCLFIPFFLYVSIYQSRFSCQHIRCSPCYVRLWIPLEMDVVWSLRLVTSWLSTMNVEWMLPSTEYFIGGQILTSSLSEVEYYMIGYDFGDGGCASWNWWWSMDFRALVWKTARDHASLVWISDVKVKHKQIEVSVCFKKEE